MGEEPVVATTQKYIPPSQRRRETGNNKRNNENIVESTTNQTGVTVWGKESNDARLATSNVVDNQNTNNKYTMQGAGLKETEDLGDDRSKNTITAIHMNGLVFTNILNHCMEQHPIPVNGQLLGSEQPSTKQGESIMEITSSFPLPQKRDIYSQVMREKASQLYSNTGGMTLGDREIENRVEEEYELYQDKMAEFLHDLRSDYFTVGYYQTVVSGTTFDKENFEGLLAYQEAMGIAIMVIFDPLFVHLGSVPLKAFILNSEALRDMKERETQAEAMTSNFQEHNQTGTSWKSHDRGSTDQIDHETLLVEIPIFINHSYLDSFFIHSWLSNSPFLGDGGTIATGHQFISMLDKFTERNLPKNNKSQAIFPPNAEILSNICIDSDTALASIMSHLQSSLDMLSDETDRLHRYLRLQYRQMLLQRQIKERKRLEEERRRLRGEDDHVRSDDWVAGLDAEIWDELKGLRKMDPPSPSNWYILNAEVSRREEELQDICRHGIAAVGLVQFLNQSDHIHE